VRPVIGITAYAEPEVAWGAWRVPAAVLPLAYVASVESAGGRALLVPPVEEDVEETLAVLDGIVFSGGSDLDPALYESSPHETTTVVRPERDRAELALLRAALDRDLPTLAVCRGSQVLNVARGGDLDQHLPDSLGHEGHREVPGTYSRHRVEVGGGTRLEAILGSGIEVHSHHHQGYGRIGAGLAVAARAEDGTPEALEDPSKRFALGVLWHPEEHEDKALFAALVEEARRYRAERR
jgi:putative glutamine amidotransferase